MNEIMTSGLTVPSVVHNDETLLSTQTNLRPGNWTPEIKCTVENMSPDKDKEHQSRFFKFTTNNNNKINLHILIRMAILEKKKLTKSSGIRD